MKADQLLIPRFEVIGGYPFSEFNIGDILFKSAIPEHDHYLCDNVKSGIRYETLEKYPNIFRKMQWWEKRTKQEMPGKLICKAIPDDNQILNIEDWDMDILFGWLDKSTRSGCGLLSFTPEYGYFPVD